MNNLFFPGVLHVEGSDDSLLFSLHALPSSFLLQPFQVLPAPGQNIKDSFAAYRQLLVASL
jgi:hypothetical protein